MIYWGEGGQYGSFDVQEDGWPNAGQVQRYFREKAGMSAEMFATAYSEGLKKLGKQNKKGKQGKQGKVTANWILNMEKQNTIPTDITRRRLIADILSIPPMLLGLASLEQISLTQQGDKKTAELYQPQLQKVSADIPIYQHNMQSALRLHRTGSAQDILQNLLYDIQALKTIEQRVKGDLLYQIQELTLSNYFLSANILLDQREYTMAYTFTNDAIQVAKSMQDDELLARAFCARAYIRLMWGLFGTLKNGQFVPDREKLEAAIRDCKTALNLSGLHPQLEGNLMLHLGRALGTLRTSNRDTKITQALTYADQAEGKVNSNPIDDLYTRTLVTGSPAGLHRGSYLLGRAMIFNATGQPAGAIQDLTQYKRLTQGEPRKHIWANIVLAEALMSQGEFVEATKQAKHALKFSQELGLTTNIIAITDIYHRLASTSYGKSVNVRELGEMLIEKHKQV